MKQILAIRLGRRWGSFDIKGVVLVMGQEMGLSKAQIKRLIQQGAVEVILTELENNDGHDPYDRGGFEE